VPLNLPPQPAHAALAPAQPEGPSAVGGPGPSASAAAQALQAFAPPPPQQPPLPSPSPVTQPAQLDIVTVMESMRAWQEKLEKLLPQALPMKRKPEGDLQQPEEEEESGEPASDEEESFSEHVEEEETDRRDPRVSRAPPPLSPIMRDEIVLGRIGSFVTGDARTKLYTKKWKAPASLLVEAKDQPAPKDPHWHVPAKEANPLLLVDLFNKADRVVAHSSPSLSFGSATVAARLKESSLLSKEEKDYLKTGMETEQARDQQLFWRAVRLHQEALICEAHTLDKERFEKFTRARHPEWWTQLREEYNVYQADDSASQPDTSTELDEAGTTVAAQHAALMAELTGNTVALFMETLKQGYRKAHLLAAKAMKVSPDALGSSAPRHEVLVCPPTMLAEAQASAALPYFGTLPQQRGGARDRGQKRKARRAPTKIHKDRGQRPPGAPGSKPASNRSPPKPRGYGQDRQPAAPKRKMQKKRTDGSQQKRQKKE